VIRARWALPVALLASFQQPVLGQDWAARFPPAPECQPQLRRSSVLDSTLQLVGRARIIVIPRVLGTPDILSYLQAGLTPISHPPAKTPRRASRDTAQVRVVETDTTGPHVLSLGGIGYAGFADTLNPRIGYSDTIVVWLRHADDDYRNIYNCRPRGFRLAGEPACVTDTAETSALLDLALRYAQRTEQKTVRLAPFDSTQVAVIRNEKTCLRAAQLYGAPGDPPRRVVVVRMGPQYLVYDPYEPLPAGEWNIYRLFDRRWRPLFDILG
jgi:hypothetical protein